MTFQGTSTHRLWYTPNFSGRRECRRPPYWILCSVCDLTWLDTQTEDEERQEQIQGRWLQQGDAKIWTVPRAEKLWQIMSKHIQQQNYGRQRLLKKRLLTIELFRCLWQQVNAKIGAEWRVIRHPLLTKRDPKHNLFWWFPLPMFSEFVYTSFSCLNKVVCISMFFLNSLLFTWGENVVLILLLEPFWTRKVW